MVVAGATLHKKGCIFHPVLFSPVKRLTGQETGVSVAAIDNKALVEILELTALQRWNEIARF
jgi:hypothetical protein